MFRLAKPVFAAALIAFAGMPAFAADYVEPPVVEAPPVYQPAPEYGGWYIRGDLDYHWTDFGDAEYITYGVTCCGLLDPGTNSLSGDLDGAFSIGGGVGYQITSYLRTDLTADYWFSSDFEGSTTGDCGGVVCVSTDTSSYSAWLLLANAYADLGTYYGFTPYVGAGIGGAHVSWDDLNNTVSGVTTVHEGSDNWRFAWALMAGTSYCLTDNLKLDVGYRFSHINGGRMFELAPTTGPGAGPGFDDGFNVHEARAGLRYQFGNSGCYEPEPVPYEPAPQPIYK
jgi:opacity protein-like surface antigen